MRKSYSEWIINHIFFRSWWVIVTFLLCVAFHEHQQKKRDDISTLLSKQMNDLLKEKKVASAIRSQLLMQINSQNDHDWIVLILMKELGLVPEGQTKVHFIPQQKIPL